MTTHPCSKTSSTPGPSRRRGLAAALVCALLVLQPAMAANPPAANAPATANPAAADEATFNFVGADVESVVKAIGQFTHTTFLVDPRIKGQINLVSEKPVTRQQALKLLTAVLRMAGYAMVNGDGFVKIVPEIDAKIQLGNVQPGTAKGDQIATQIFKLNYESATNVGNMVRPLISANNALTVDAAANALVITDYADNLARMGKIIAALDEPSITSPDIVPIKHAVAADIATTVNRLLETPNTPDKIILYSDARTNSVIIRAPSMARVVMVKSLLAKLDQPTAESGNVHVVKLKNAEATKLAQTLRAVVSGDAALPASAAGSPSGGGGIPSGLSSSGAMGGMIAQAASAVSGGGGGGGGSAGFIQADAATNTLIITASETVYRSLRAVIDRLDRRRAQVFVESLIVEVSATKAAEFGVQWLGLSGDRTSDIRVGAATSFSTAGNNLANQALASKAGVPLPPGNGITLGIFRQVGGQLGLGAVAHALENNDNANILSMPNLITLDNEEAKIIVGQNVPFITGSYTTQASAGAAGVNPFQTVERKDIGLSLRVRPQISEGGTVKMAIYQEVSQVQDTSNVAGIITSKRSIETNVLVDDGQIIVLGGLIDQQVQDTNELVPGLGSIPVVGNLFKYQTRKRTKTNLMVFIRPTVIRDSDQSVSVSTDRYDYMRNSEIDQPPPNAFALPNVEPLVLPPLENGKPVGGDGTVLRNTMPPATGGGQTSVAPAAPAQPAAPVPVPALPATPAPPN